MLPSASQVITRTRCLVKSVKVILQSTCTSSIFLPVHATAQSSPRCIPAVAQIPNFLLAMPALLLAAAACCTYAQQCPAGLVHVVTAGLLWRALQLCQGRLHDERQQPWKAQQNFNKRALAATGYDDGFLAPSVAHFLFPLAFMAGCAATVMHVQVGTRFLSSSPALYWFMAHLWVCGLEAGEQAGAIGHGARACNQGNAPKCKGSRRAGCLTWAWSLAFVAAGTVMFPNFYPWT